ncbi:unnamed protein product [Paramecium sonneborni]|uniref:Uncharacterized protein n=1 Tax=Paramecium sonneborni TaxID=65129 RepID=A0A8S1QZE2_9CILI|nr:unnamed protein product [Paramecium sonneborni]
MKSLSHIQKQSQIKQQFKEIQNFRNINLNFLYKYDKTSRIIIKFSFSNQVSYFKIGTENIYYQSELQSNFKNTAGQPGQLTGKVLNDLRFSHFGLNDNSSRNTFMTQNKWKHIIHNNKNILINQIRLLVQICIILIDHIISHLSKIEKIQYYNHRPLNGQPNFQINSKSTI